MAEVPVISPGLAKVRLVLYPLSSRKIRCDLKLIDEGGQRQPSTQGRRRRCWRWRTRRPRAGARPEEKILRVERNKTRRGELRFGGEASG